MTLAVYVGLVGLTIVLVRSPLFNWMRARWIGRRRAILTTEHWRWYDFIDQKRVELLSCALCLGVWVGLAGGFWMRGTRDPVLTVLDAFVVSVVSWLTYHVGDTLDLVSAWLYPRIDKKEPPA